jgi:hypothetical protein
MAKPISRLQRGKPPLLTGRGKEKKKKKKLHHFSHIRLIRRHLKKKEKQEVWNSMSETREKETSKGRGG